MTPNDLSNDPRNDLGNDLVQIIIPSSNFSTKFSILKTDSLHRLRVSGSIFNSKMTIFDLMAPPIIRGSPRDNKLLVT